MGPRITRQPHRCLEPYLLATLLAAWTAAAATFPRDPSVLDARLDLGAAGDGLADDTAALQRGLDSSGGMAGPTCLLYLPNGNYRITRPLLLRSLVGPWVCGESKDGVTLHLVAPDGSSSNNAALETVGLRGPGNPGAGRVRDLRDLTIDTSCSPGSDAIHWMANTGGLIREVSLKGNGGAGLVVEDPGGLGGNRFEGLSMRGFDTGVVIARSLGDIWRRLQIRGCRLTGISLRDTDAALDGVLVDGARCAVMNAPTAALDGTRRPVTLANATLRGHDEDGAAIRNAGALEVRGLRVDGYRQAIQELPGGRLEWEGAIGVPAPPADLPASGRDPAGWVCANAFGAAPDDDADDGPALQRAIDFAAATGAATVYLRGAGADDPRGYLIGKEVRLRGSVSRLTCLGFGHAVAGAGGRLVVDDNSARQVVVEGLQAFGGAPVTVENRSAAGVVTLDSCEVLILASGSGRIVIADGAEALGRLPDGQASAALPAVRPVRPTWAAMAEAGCDKPSVAKRNLGAD